MATDIEIASNALILIGDDPITSLSSASTIKREKIMAKLFPTSRDFVLRSHPWNCVVKRAKLTSPGLNVLDAHANLSIAGNLATRGVANDGVAAAVRGTKGVLVGGTQAVKAYFEFHMDSFDTDAAVGLANSSAVLNAIPGANSWSYQASTGEKWTGATNAAYGDTWGTGDIIGVAADLTTGAVTFYLNNVTQGAAFASLTGLLYPAVSLFGAGSFATAKFLEDEWEYDAPDGYVPWPAKAPLNEWAYEAPLPTDWLRTLSVGREGADDFFRLESGKLLSDEAAMELRYIFKQTDPAKWDASLTKAMELYLAWQGAYPITKSASLAESMAKLFAEHLRAARTIDGQEQPSEDSSSFPLIEARYSWPQSGRRGRW